MAPAPRGSTGSSLHLPAAAPAVEEQSPLAWLVASPWRYRGVVAGLLVAYCLLGLGGSIVAYDEAWYTVPAREMLAQGSFWTVYYGGEPRYYKPPLTMWGIMASYALLGESDWAARLPSALLAALAALLALGLAWELFGDPQTNLLALLLFLLTPGTLGLSHTVQTDVYLFVGLAAGVYAWFRARRDWRWYGLFALGLGWGLLSKSAAALALPGWALVLAGVRREWRQLGGVVVATGLGMLLLVPWLLINLADDPQGFVHVALLQEIVQRALGEYGPHPNTLLDHLLFYPRVILLGSLPWTLLLLVPMGRALGSLFRREALVDQALGWWVALPLVAYTLIQGKLDSYIFPVMLSMALLTAAHLRRGVGRGWLAGTAGLLIVMGLGVLGGAGVWVWYKGESQYLGPGLVLGLGCLVLGPVVLWQVRAGRLPICRDVLLGGVGIVLLATLAASPFNYNPDFAAFSQVALPQLPVLVVGSERGAMASHRLLVAHYLRLAPPEQEDLSVEAYLAQLPHLPPHLLVLDRFALDEIGPQVRARVLAQGRKWRLIEVAGPAS